MRTIDQMQYYTLSEVVRICGSYHNMFVKELQANQIPAAALVVGCRSMWSQDQVDYIKTHFDKLRRTAADRSVWQSRIPDNLYTETKVSKQLGVPLITIRSWINKDLLPKKTVVAPEGRILVWNQKEFDIIKEFVEEKKRPKQYSLKMEQLVKMCKRNTVTLHKYREILNIGRKFGNTWWFTAQEGEMLKNYVKLKSVR